MNENDINHHDGSGQPVSHVPRLATDAKDKPFIDLVCGMKVRANPGKTVDYEATAYHFCSMGCVTKFKTDPQKYLSQRPRESAAPAERQAEQTRTL